MSGENQSNQQQATKPRKKRGPSRFMVLQEVKDREAVSMALTKGERVYICKAEPDGIKSARADIRKRQIVGDLLTVCIRRRGKATVQTTLDIVGL